MAKNFFQDMIRIKSEIRKEIGEQEKPAYKPELKPEPAPAPKVKVKPVEQKLESKPVTAPVQDSWTPLVPHRVESKVELLTGEVVRRPRYSLWIVAGASLVFLFFAVSFFLAKASITITPKTAEFSLNENFLAGKEASGAGTLAFDLIALPGEEVRTLAGGEVKDVKLPAKGTVIIYNNFSSATQRLDIDTRLEGSNGKMYKTERQVTVPGMKGTTPGSIEVGIYATEAGASYNSGPLDFQIFGFKGTAKYSKFYARSKSDIIGGFIGKVATVPDSERKSASSEMQAILKEKLARRATDLIPEGFILFPDAILFTLDNETFGASPTDTTQVPVSVKGTLYGFLFNQEELTAMVAKQAIPSYDDSKVYISNINELIFSLLNQDSTPGDVKNISFNLSGKPNFVWKFDDAKLLGEIAGKSKSAFNEIISQYPNVISAEVVLRPIWRRSFPDTKGDIEIKINYPNINTSKNE